MKIDRHLKPAELLRNVQTMFEASAEKILCLDKAWDPGNGAPVFTRKGVYTSRGWTEWTQGFQFGAALLQFDATADGRFLEIGRRGTVRYMAAHVSHTGVHDHGFNNISTYGNLLRLIREGRIETNPDERNFCELALKVSGAVQAARWTDTADGGGYIYSFNGPHSLFVDTIRSLRSLAVAHQLGHVLMTERDRKVSLLTRLVQHAASTARYNIYYGEGRDDFDVAGRTAHECIFNVNDGNYRCPNSQQGYSPFTTWTRGLAWALLGFTEQLEFLETVRDRELAAAVESTQPAAATAPGIDADRAAALVRATFLRAAQATAEFYIGNSCADGVPMWDTGAPNLHRMGDHLARNSDPFNAWEPVDSSAAAIAAQGLVRLGNFLTAKGDGKNGKRYYQAGLTVARTLLQEPYLSLHPDHQGLLLHSVYHRPNGWDHIPKGQKVPNGESSMWGDYHLRELGLLLLRLARGESYLTFFEYPGRAVRASEPMIVGPA